MPTSCLNNSTSLSLYASGIRYIIDFGSILLSYNRVMLHLLVTVFYRPTMPSSLLIICHRMGGRWAPTRRCLENRMFRRGLEGRCRLILLCSLIAPFQLSTGRGRTVPARCLPAPRPMRNNYDGGIEGQDQDRGLQQKKIIIKRAKKLL